MGRNGRKVAVGLSLLMVAAACFWIFSRPSTPLDKGSAAIKPEHVEASSANLPQANSAVPAVNPLPKAPDAAISAWPRWGGAFNSAEFSGANFFDRRMALKFLSDVDPKLHAYAVELNARAFLPLTLDPPLARGELFPDADRNPAVPERTLYIQFLDHPTDVQRAQLKAAGVELLAYAGGYAWTARGSIDALLDCARLPYVRALARIDPRDKLHGEVYAQRTPSYAQETLGNAHFSVLAVPGTSLDAMFAEWSSMPEFNGMTVSLGKASVLGPRFEVVASANLAERLAAASHAAFIEFTAPPVASRDSTTDSSSNISIVRDNGPLLTGAGVTVAVRELGKPEAHVDYISRTLFVDNDGDITMPGVYTHATAVVGQIASNGVAQPTAKGVAPAANILVYSLVDGSFATTDIVDASQRNARISNHSYGPSGLSTFGDYMTISADWDAAIQVNNLIAFFAGNEESDAGKYNHIDFFVGMKNGLCIEASSAQANAGNPLGNPPVSATDGSAFFAKYGPMNDGRVKPDLVAFGDDVTLDTGTNSVTQNTGTSFSTPAASGVAALVFQQYKRTLGGEPNAALMKALLCESASDLGTPGPDSVYGFGIVNAAAAVALINLRRDPTTTPFAEGSLGNGESQSFTIGVPPNTPVLKTTLCWMDVAGNPANAKALINDLDMILTDPDGVQHFPYSLNASAAAAAATNTGPNTVDPIEQTIIPNPKAGVWTVKLSGTSVPQGPQRYAFCSNIVLSTQLLIAFAQASPTSGPSPLDVSFSAAGSVGNIVNYIWDFGDGTTGTGETVSHTYEYPLPPATGNYTATLVVVDAEGKSDSYSLSISVSKPLEIVYALQASGRVDLNKPTSDQLQMTLIIPNLVRTAQEAREAIRDGVFEGKKYTVRVGLMDPVANTASFNTLYTFLLDRRATDTERSQSFKINLRSGSIATTIKTSIYQPVRNMATVFKSLGISKTVASPYDFLMRVQIETNDAVYQSDYKLEYNGRDGKGTVKLAKTRG